MLGEPVSHSATTVEIDRRGAAPVSEPSLEHGRAVQRDRSEFVRLWQLKIELRVWPRSGPLGAAARVPPPPAGRTLSHVHRAVLPEPGRRKLRLRDRGVPARSSPADRRSISSLARRRARSPQPPGRDPDARPRAGHAASRARPIFYSRTRKRPAADARAQTLDAAGLHLRSRRGARSERLAALVAVLAMLGLAVAAYLTYVHYEDRRSRSAPAGARMLSRTVQNSSYAESRRGSPSSVLRPDLLRRDPRFAVGCRATSAASFGALTALIRASASACT